MAKLASLPRITRPRRAHRRGDGRRGDRGGVSAQVAIVPAAAALLFFTVQVSLWFHARSVATAAAQHGLDATRVEEGSEGAGRSTVNQFVSQVGGFDVESLTVNRGAETATVTIRGQPTVVLPYFSVPINVTLEAPVERVPE
jgi:hypothetical protein